MAKISASKYETMKSEFKDVMDIFLDDTQNSEQTIQLITEVAGAAIAVQGLGELPEKEDKAKVMGLMALEIAVSHLRGSILDEVT